MDANDASVADDVEDRITDDGGVVPAIATPDVTCVVVAENGCESAAADVVNDDVMTVGRNTDAKFSGDTAGRVWAADDVVASAVLDVFVVVAAVVTIHVASDVCGDNVDDGIAVTSCVCALAGRRRALLALRLRVEVNVGVGAGRTLIGLHADIGLARTDDLLVAD